MTPIIQGEASECGLASLAIACRELGAHYSLSELRAKFPASVRGQTLRHIMEAAEDLGLNTRAVRCEPAELCELALPAILHWELGHFVVLTKVNGRSFDIEDPAIGRRRISQKDMARSFTGVALEITRSETFQRRRMRPRLSVLAVLPWNRPIWTGLVQTMVLAFVVQAFVLASPFYMQLAIDEAGLRGDVELLYVIALGFGALSIFNVAASFLREIAAQRVAALMGWGMTVRLYTHLLRLPLGWFQKRKLADTLVRFDSIEPIRQFIANSLSTALVDVLVVLGTLVMMLVYAPVLAVIAIIAAAAYLIVKVSTIPVSLRYASQELVASISEQGKRIETLKAIQTIKAMGAEGERERDWSGHYAEVVRTAQTNGLVRFSIQGVQDFLEAVTYAIIVFMAVMLVIRAEMTVGAVFAFVAYRAQFQQRTVSLFDAVVNWRMLDLHTDRLSDIVLERQEVLQGTGVGRVELSGAIELDNIAFRYSQSDPLLFHGVKLKIAQGDMVAFVGPSGTGKTTLLKVAAGLYGATSGRVLLDGHPLEAWGAQKVRKACGMVLQDDELLSGSILDNVTFFSTEVDVAFAWECLKAAAIDEEVSRMAMGIETQVGDMGSSLSGGQKQRILLARALYRRPKILLLDEATSHLDIGNERLVSGAIAKLSITRLIVAHRRETIASADHIVAFENGAVKVYSSPRVTAATDPVAA